MNSLLASQSLGERIAEQGVRTIRFARSKIGDPPGGIRNIPDRRIELTHFVPFGFRECKFCAILVASCPSNGTAGSRVGEQNSSSASYCSSGADIENYI
jgi:hypothetical protein